jgi:hypothetical protein
VRRSSAPFQAWEDSSRPVLLPDVDASNDNRIHDFIVGAFVDLLVACLISLHREENR